jgi:hypothetical protein
MINTWAQMNSFPTLETNVKLEKLARLEKLVSKAISPFW